MQVFESGRMPALAVVVLMTGAAAAFAGEPTIKANSPPGFSGMGLITVDEDAVVTYSFNVSDVDTGPESVQVDVWSGNTALVSDASLAAGLSGSGAQRSLRIAPSADRSGVTAINFKLTDPDGASIQVLAELRVSDVNDAPTMSPGPNIAHAPGSWTTGYFTFPGWVSMISAGTTDEAWQQVQFEVLRDPGQPEIADTVMVDANGDLYYHLTGTQGEMRLRVVPVDDGGTLGGGVDRGQEQELRIAVGAGTDLVTRIERLPVKRDPSALTDKMLAQANYRVSVYNNGPLDAAGVALAVDVDDALDALLWSCNVPDAVCEVSDGVGNVRTGFALPVGATAVIDIEGDVQPGHRFAELIAGTLLPPGSATLLPYDDRFVLVDPLSEEASFRGGFE